MYNNERLELLENSTLFKFWQNGKLKHYSWNGDDLPQQFGHPHCFRHNKQHVLRPSKGWMVDGGTHVLPPGTRERAPWAASKPKRRCLSVVRLSVRPARQWESGQSSPYLGIICLEGSFVDCCPYLTIQVVGSYLNATICDMHLFKISHIPHSKWEDQLFLFSVS